MVSTYHPLKAGFATADAVRPEIEYRNGTLAIRFIDWREQPVAVQFPDTVAFRWQDQANLPPDVRDDLPYEVFDSPWVAELMDLGAIQGECHHYTLCFNACGVLDVVSGPLVTGPGRLTSPSET